jgi:hypothetical protein
MTPDASRRATSRPFTVAVCMQCGAEPDLAVLTELRATIRRCPHAVLATTGCLRGPLTCLADPHDRGVMIILQPCAVDRTPTGPTIWIGPICDDTDLHAVRSWLERGSWNLDTLPVRLNTIAQQRLPSRMN